MQLPPKATRSRGFPQVTAQFAVHEAHHMPWTQLSRLSEPSLSVLLLLLLVEMHADGDRTQSRHD